MAIRMFISCLILLSGTVLSAAQQERASAPGERLDARTYMIPARTRIPLVLVNSVSTKTSEVGDRVYLQTSFPVSSGTRIVIPEGSYVTGTITQVKRPGRVRGRGELYVRFDTLMLRNGVSRDFRGTVTATDGSQSDIAEEEGTIRGEGTKGRDVATAAGAAAQGASIGAVVGAADSGSPGKGAAIGAGIGAAAGMIGVLLTRGKEVVLLRGTSLEMQLDRDLEFYSDELDFTGSAPSDRLPPPPVNIERREVEPMSRGGVGFPYPGSRPSPF